VLHYTEGRPAILYKSLPSLVLPNSDNNAERGRQKTLDEVAAAGPAVIPLKETLARRLSASMDCIDASGDSDGKTASAAAGAPAADTATATAASETQLAVDESATTTTERPWIDETANGQIPLQQLHRKISHREVAGK